MSWLASLVKKFSGYAKIDASDPSLKGFDAIYYMKAYPDVAASGMDPLNHFIRYGRAEGRRVCAPETIKVESADAKGGGSTEEVSSVTENVAEEGTHDDFVRSVIEPHFDKAYYIRRYPTAALSRMSPVDHYIETGWRQGFNPNADFDTQQYLAANPDVVEARVNPFYHYIVAGREEGRHPRLQHANERTLLEQTKTMTQRSADWALNYAARAPMSPEALTESLNRLVPEHRGKFILSLSHDEYTMNFGGIQNCVRDEQRAANYSGATYCHIAPARPDLTLRAEDGVNDLVTITVDGDRIGHALPSDVVRVIERRVHANRATDTALVVHSFLGFSVSFLRGLSEAIGGQNNSIWIHDCSTLCSNYALLRNDLEFCWSPDLDSWACKVCVYGEERKRHVANVRALFEALMPQVFFPSEVIMKLWLDRGYKTFRKAVVRPHGIASFQGRRPQLENGRALRIAFVGAAAPHKGWHVFKELVRAFGGDERYSFYHFASFADPSSEDIKFVKASVNSVERDAMIAALMREQIDVVVQWSLCFETFSFTTYEAILSGAFVLARSDSGNVAAEITKNNVGRLLETSGELLSLFRSDELFRLVKSFRKTRAKTGRLELPTVDISQLFDLGAIDAHSLLH